MMHSIAMEYNAECSGEKYRESARAINVADNDKMSQEEYRVAAIKAVRKLSSDVGIPVKLEALKEKTWISWLNQLMRMHVGLEIRRIPMWKF